MSRPVQVNGEPGATRVPGPALAPAHALPDGSHPRPTMLTHSHTRAHTLDMAVGGSVGASWKGAVGRTAAGRPGRCPSFTLGVGLALALQGKRDRDRTGEPSSCSDLSWPEGPRSLVGEARAAWAGPSPSPQPHYPAGASVGLGPTLWGAGGLLRTGLHRAPSRTLRRLFPLSEMYFCSGKVVFSLWLWGHPLSPRDPSV